MKFREMINALLETPGYVFGERAAATFLMLERLESLGRVFSPSVCEYHQDGCELDAYSISSDGCSLSLFVTVMSGNDVEGRIEDLVRGAIKMFQVCSQELSAEMSSVPEIALFAKRVAALRSKLREISICALVVGPSLNRSFGELALANARVKISVADSDMLFPSEPDKGCCMEFSHPCPAIAVRSPGSCSTYLMAVDAMSVGQLYLKYGDSIVDDGVRPLVLPNSAIIRDIKKSIQNTPELVMSGNRGVTFVAGAIDATGSDGCVSVASVCDLRLTDGYQTMVAAGEIMRKHPDKRTGALVPMKVVVKANVGDACVSRLTALQQHRQGKGCASDSFGADPVIVRLARAFDVLSRSECAKSLSPVCFKILKKGVVGGTQEALVFSKEEVARAANAADGFLGSFGWSDVKSVRFFVDHLLLSEIAMDTGFAQRIAAQTLVYRRALELLGKENTDLVVRSLAGMAKSPDVDWSDVWTHRATTGNVDELILFHAKAELPAPSSELTGVQTRRSPHVRVRVAKVPPMKWFALLAWARETANFTVAERSALFRVGLTNRFGGICDIHTAGVVWSLLQSAIKLGFRYRR